MESPCTSRRYRIVLAPESSNEETDSTETIYSMQDKETEYVRDESDTCTKSDSSEYTVYSLPSEQNPFVESESSDAIIKTENIVIETIFQSNSATPTTSSSLISHEGTTHSSSDSELGQADYWNCVQCRKSNNHPKYRYCMKCFQLRKEIFPPPPKGTKKRSELGSGSSKTLSKYAKSVTTVAGGVANAKKRKISTDGYSNESQMLVGSCKSMKFDACVGMETSKHKIDNAVTIETNNHKIGDIVTMETSKHKIDDVTIETSEQKVNAVVTMETSKHTIDDTVTMKTNYDQISETSFDEIKRSDEIILKRKLGSTDCCRDTTNIGLDENLLGKHVRKDSSLTNGVKTESEQCKISMTSSSPFSDAYNGCFNGDLRTLAQVATLDENPIPSKQQDDTTRNSVLNSTQSATLVNNVHLKNGLTMAHNLLNQYSVGNVTRPNGCTRTSDCNSVGQCKEECSSDCQSIPLLTDTILSIDPLAHLKSGFDSSSPTSIVHKPPLPPPSTMTTNNKNGLSSVSPAVTKNGNTTASNLCSFLNKFNIDSCQNLLRTPSPALENVYLSSMRHLETPKTSRTFQELCEEVERRQSAGLTEEDSGFCSTSGASPTGNVCIMCERRPKNAGFVHKYEVHVCSCYSCALKAWKKTKKCPICNLRASNVMRIIVS